MTLALAAIDALARIYSLVLPDALTRLHSGDLLGRGTGSSIEYQDHRSYFLGDDVRHIDWRAFARTDRMTMKMFRQEISPSIDVVVDASRSCGVDAAKRGLVLDVAALLATVAAHSRAHLRLWAVAGGMRALARASDLASLEFRADVDPVGALQASPIARRRGLKLFVSDFLFPHDPADLVASLAGASDRLVFVQVLSRFEARPGEEAGDGVRLIDADSGERLDVTLDAAIIAEYGTRLRHLQGELERQVQRAGGVFAALEAGIDLATAAAALARRHVLTVPA